MSTPTDKRIVWAPDARTDLREIWNYYAATTTLDAADKMLRVVVAATTQLSRVRMPGRPRDELLPGLRSVFTRPYSVFFRVAEDRIEIVRVLHERRDLLAQFGRDRE